MGGWSIVLGLARVAGIAGWQLVKGVARVGGKATWQLVKTGAPKVGKWAGKELKNPMNWLLWVGLSMMSKTQAGTLEGSIDESDKPTPDELAENCTAWDVCDVLGGFDPFGWWIMRLLYKEGQMVFNKEVLRAFAIQHAGMELYLRKKYKGKNWVLPVLKEDASDSDIEKVVLDLLKYINVRRMEMGFNGDELKLEDALSPALAEMFALEAARGTMAFMHASANQMQNDAADTIEEMAFIRARKIWVEGPTNKDQMNEVEVLNMIM